MSFSPLKAVVATLTAAVLASACVPDAATGPSARALPGALARSGSPGPLPSGSGCAAGYTARTITFDEYRHGDPVTTASLSGAGPAVSIALSVVPSPQAPGDPDPILAGTRDLHAFDTNDQTHPEDTDLMVDPAGQCVNCRGLNRVLIIESERGFATDGDYQWGGQITLTGFPAGSYVDRYTVVDNEVYDATNEAPVRMYVNGTLVGESTRQGDASVEVVDPAGMVPVTSNVMFSLGTQAADAVGASGAIDNIVVCVPRETIGREGCTPGYWKNHERSWAAASLLPGATLESVFDVPDTYMLDNVTLHAALSLKGGSGTEAGARLLLHHATAALLNAAHPGVDYAQASADIISATNAALVSGDRSAMLALKDSFDADNNRGCPIN